jgi:alpha-1,3-glucosyltransferase
VVLDSLEKLYLAGFPLLLAFITLLPTWVKRPNIKADVFMYSGEFSGPEPENQVKKPGSAMEFLPLMLTSVYCAVGLVWGFFRLMFIYLNEETAYQGQLSSLG